MNKQQLNQKPHFSRLLAIFHERELIVLGLMMNLSVIALFGLASNSFHLQTYAQLFEGREFEVPAQPDGCNGQCVYSYNSGGFFKKEAVTGGGISFTPCQSATSCGPSSGSGSSGGSGTSGGNTANINNPNCATSVGCSQVKPNGSTIFCVSGLCSECNSAGSCARAGEWPANVVNNGNFCSGPGCAPGSISPSQCTAGSACTAQSPGSGPGQLNYTQVMIGNQLVEFEAGSDKSKDGKYSRTCASAGSCTITLVTGGSGPFEPIYAYTLDRYVPTNSECYGGPATCKFEEGDKIYDCSKGLGGFYSCAVSVKPNSSGAAILDSYVITGNGSATQPYYIRPRVGSSAFTQAVGEQMAKFLCGNTAADCYVYDYENDRTFVCQNGNCQQTTNYPGVIDPNNRPNYQAPGTQPGTTGSGTYSDPFRSGSVSQLISSCGGARGGCYGTVDGQLYECQNGSCGPFRTPPGGSTGGITAEELERRREEERAAQRGTKGGNPWLNIPEPGDGGIPYQGANPIYYFPGGSYASGFSVFSVGTSSQPVYVCGDLVCSGNETPASCPQDCGGSAIACTVGAARKLVCE